MLACVLLVGCNLTPTIGMGPQKIGNVPVDKHPYVSETSAVALPRVVNGDDCGACETNPTVQYVLGPHTTRLEWDQPGLCRGWYIFESSDLSAWNLVDTVLSYGNPSVTYSRTTTNNPVFWRVATY